jgi:hypothetical protein
MRRGVNGHTLVMPGLVPGIHVFEYCGKQDVDGRDKPGHDDYFVGTCRALASMGDLDGAPAGTG